MSLLVARSFFNENEEALDRHMRQTVERCPVAGSAELGRLDVVLRGAPAITPTERAELAGARNRANCGIEQVDSNSFKAILTVNTARRGRGQAGENRVDEAEFPPGRLHRQEIYQPRPQFSRFDFKKANCV